MECYSCHINCQPEFNFCPNCGVNLKAITCPSCSFSNKPNSKFCQECGNSLQAKAERKSKPPQEPSIETPIPSTGITVEFHYSSSQSYEFAVEAARKIPGYQLFGLDKKSVHRVNVNQDEIYTLDELLDCLKGWRKRFAYVDGEKKEWDSVFDYVHCYRSRKSSYKPELFCFGYNDDYNFNLWGCIHTGLSFQEYSDLFTLGEWIDKEGTWKFDKERIQHRLEKELYRFRFCPALDLDRIKSVLDALPEQVNPNRMKGWKFIEDYGATEGLSVIQNSYGYEQRVFVKGVAPVTRQVILDSIKKRLSTTLPQDLK